MAQPLISNCEFNAGEDYPRDLKPESSSFSKLAVLVSVLLHSMLAVFFVTFKVEAPTESRLRAEAKFKSTQIGLRRENPYSISEPLPLEPLNEESIPQEMSLESTSELNPVLEETAVVETVPPSSMNEIELANESSASGEDNARLETTGPISPSALPTPDSIASSVRDVSRANQTQFFSYVCSPLEEDESIRKCEPRLKTDYDGLEKNATYEAFNPSREVTRSETVSGVVSSQARGLSARLEGQVPEGLSGYIMEELEAGITHNVNGGNRAVRHMLNNTDKSSAAAQARQVLENPLLIDLKRAKQNPTRGILISPP